MFRPTGGIHDLPASVGPRVEEDGAGLIDGPGLAILIDRIQETGRLFSDLKARGAVSGGTVNMTGLRELGLEGLTPPSTAVPRPGPERDLQNG